MVSAEAASAVGSKYVAILKYALASRLRMVSMRLEITAELHRDVAAWEEAFCA